MKTLLFLINAAYAQDHGDIRDKKEKVQKQDIYYKFDVHHKNPGSKYVYGYYVFELEKRDEAVSIIETATEEANQKFSNH